MAIKEKMRLSLPEKRLRTLRDKLYQNEIPDEATITPSVYGNFLEIAQLLHRHARSGGAASLKKYEASLLIERPDIVKIISGAAPAPAPKTGSVAAECEQEQKYELHPLSFFKNLPKREWGIDKIIFDRGTSVFVGDGGSGKSTFVLDMMLSRVYGRDFLGHPTKRGFIVWIAAESVDEIFPRVYAWMLKHGIPEEAAPDIWFLDERVPFNNLAEVDTFIEAVREQTEDMGKEVAGFVFDTYARCTPGSDENNTQETKLIAESIAKISKEFNTHVAVIHHTNAQGRIRGNTALRDDVDTVWNVTKEQGGGIKLHCDKMRGQLEPPDFFVKMHSQLLSDTDLEDTAPVIVSAEGDLAEPFTPKAQLQMLEILQAHVRLSCNQWQKHCEKSLGIAQATFYNHLKTLKLDGSLVLPSQTDKGKPIYYSVSTTGTSLLKGGNEDE